MAVVFTGTESKRKDNSLVPIIPPDDTIPTSDWRTKYVGKYAFNVKAFNYQVGEDSVYWDSLLYQYQGSIEVYKNDRLLIKYSAFPPFGRCVSNDGSWCQGLLNDVCVANCNGQLYFVQYWVSPLIYSNDSLLLFKNYPNNRGAELNGSGKFNHDSIIFSLKLHEKLYGFEEYITGKREK